MSKDADPNPRDPFAGQTLSAQPGARRRTPVPHTIRRYYVPLPVLQRTDASMRKFAAEERECYIWWGGYFTGQGEAQVVTALCPDIKSDFGRVHLGLRDIAALHTRLRGLDQVLLVELHTHPPGAGGQNPVDAAHPAAPYRGFISIIVPDFALPRFSELKAAFVYEYVESNRWRELAPEEIANRFVIEPPFLDVEP
jgi:hypothetical protein